MFAYNFFHIAFTAFVRTVVGIVTSFFSFFPDDFIIIFIFGFYFFGYMYCV